MIKSEYVFVKKYNIMIYMKYGDFLNWNIQFELYNFLNWNIQFELYDL